MHSGTQRARKSFVALVFFAIANILLLITFNVHPYLYPIRLLAPLFLDRRNRTSANEGIVSGGRPNDTSENDAVMENSVDRQKYRNMTEAYNKRISSIPRHKYNPSNSHIDIGPPISSLLNVSVRMSATPKLILLWTPFFGDKNWIDDTVFKQCPKTPCQITNDKSKLSESHGVIMHARDMGGKQNLPPKRQPWQRWIYFMLESPLHNYLRLSDFNNIFNWTATYRLDTDSHIGYGGLHRRVPPMKPHDLDLLMLNILKTKKKFAAARISNCNRSKTNRLSYIAQLQKYIPVDVYGQCGTMKNPRGQKGNEMLKQYKFYLSFENSHCRDYITEKFWYPFLEWSSVPVVMGASPEDYLALAPNQSFINTAGFESPKHLAEYLQLLDNNSQLYKRYFTWLTHWIPYVEYFKGSTTTSKQWCKICTDLYNMSLSLKSYRNFDGWYKEDYCSKH